MDISTSCAGIGKTTSMSICVSNERDFPAHLRILLVFLATLVLARGELFAQITQVYSFEPGLEGFAANGTVTVSLNSDSSFVSEGSNSMKLEFPKDSSFAGPASTQLPPAFTDPAGIEFLLIDLINTNRFVPENPVAGTDPTFANMGVTFFGSYVDDPGTPSDVQFLFSEQAVGELEAGTHEVKFDLTQGGVDPQFLHPDIQGYNDWIADGFVPGGFYIYLNKNPSTTKDSFAWTIYLDNIRVGNEVTGNGGDYNGNGVVDAADYTVWRDHLGGAGPEGDGTTSGDLLGMPDGIVDQWDYQFWRQQFGTVLSGGGGSAIGLTAVPEAGSAQLLLLGVGCLWRRSRGRAVLSLS